jgi:hypothetical protein
LRVDLSVPGYAVAPHEEAGCGFTDDDASLQRIGGVSSWWERGANVCDLQKSTTKALMATRVLEPPQPSKIPTDDPDTVQTDQSPEPTKRRPFQDQRGEIGGRCGFEGVEGRDW